MSEAMNDDCDLVMSVLADVLGESKFSLVDKNDVVKELSAIECDDEEFDYTGSYHPYKRINHVVAHFVSMHKKRKLDEAGTINFEKSKNELEELDNEMINAERIAEDDDDRKNTLLTSLITVYPDVDPKLLNQICTRLYNDPTKIQEWLEENIDKIPEKRQVQAINRFALESTCRSHEKIWKCPNCEMWQIIGSKAEVAKCSEVVSCGEFCIKCNKREHSPFKCRQKCQRTDNIENEVNIFKKLRTAPDEDKGYAKIFILRPQNNLDFSDPLHILYLAAEGTFLRMMEMANTFLHSNLPGSSSFPSLTSAMAPLIGPVPGLSSVTAPSGVSPTTTSSSSNVSMARGLTHMNGSAPVDADVDGLAAMNMSPPGGSSYVDNSVAGTTHMDGSANTLPSTIDGSSHMDGNASVSTSPPGGSSNMNSSGAGSTHMNGSASGSMSPLGGSSNMNSSVSTSFSLLVGSSHMNGSASASASMTPVAGSSNMNNSLVSMSMSTTDTASSHMNGSVSDRMSPGVGLGLMNTNLPTNGNGTTSENGPTEDNSLDQQISRSTNGSSSTLPMSPSPNTSTTVTFFTGGIPLHSLTAPQPPSTTQPSHGVPHQQLSSIPPSISTTAAGNAAQRIASLRTHLSTRLSGRSRRSMNMSRNSIKVIKYIENESLRGRFNSCKSYFLSRGIPNGERLVFHGTSANLDSIIRDNLQLSHCKRFAHGNGIYFSEFPSTSQIYGKHLLLCRVMLGNPYEGADHIIPEGYQSKIVLPNKEGKANMIIIDKEDQILPAFIIELENLEPPSSIS